MTKPPLLTNVYVSVPFLCVWCESGWVPVCACRYLCQTVSVYDRVCSLFDDGAGL